MLIVGGYYWSHQKGDMNILINKCKVADSEHRQSVRQYAHVGHVDNTICLAYAWKHLPLNNQMAIIAHEIGHLLYGNTDHTEQDADREVNKFLRIKILYNDSRYGIGLQNLNLDNTMDVFEWLHENVTFDY